MRGNGSTKDSACWFLPSTINLNHQLPADCGSSVPFCFALATRLENRALPEAVVLTKCGTGRLKTRAAGSGPMFPSLPNHQLSASTINSPRRPIRSRFLSRAGVEWPCVLGPSSPPRLENFILCRFMCFMRFMCRMWLYVACAVENQTEKTVTFGKVLVKFCRRKLGQPPTALTRSLVPPVTRTSRSVLTPRPPPQTVQILFQV